MQTDFAYLILLGFLAAVANISGGLILIYSGIYNRYKNSLRYILGIGAGFMLAVIFIEVFPKIIELWQKNNPAESIGENLFWPMVLVLFGYLLTQFFEHTIAPHIHLGEEVHHCEEHIVSTSSAYTAIGGLLIHTFFDGVSISAASQINFQVGVLVFLGIFLHKFPEGFTISSMILAAGKGTREVLIATSLVGLTTIIGVLFFSILGTNAVFLVNYALPISIGVTLYVAASDLIPEVNHHGGKQPLVSLSVFGGVALFFALHYLLHNFFEHLEH